MFKKIFDLNPEEVESFIRKDVKGIIERDGNILPEDVKINIVWCVACDEFYVHEEPILKTNDYQTWTFREKEMNLKDYFEIQGRHWHYTFQEIYGRITGETTFVEDVGYIGKTDVERCLGFIYNKEWTEVVRIKGKWFILTWEDDGTDYGKEVKKSVPEDLVF